MNGSMIKLPPSVSISFSVPTDEDGIDLSVLETHLKKMRPPTMEGLKSPFWAYIYTIPTFNNPKTHCVSPGMLTISFVNIHVKLHPL